VFFHVGFASFRRVVSGVMSVSPSGMGMMGCLLVVSALVMLRCLGMVSRSVAVVLCRLLVVIGRFLGHKNVSSVAVNIPKPHCRSYVPIMTTPWAACRYSTSRFFQLT
jgi:hypothetical protein